MNVELFGYAGAVLMTLMSLPQIARIVRDRSADGVSLLTWCIFAASGVSWLSYGLLLQAPAIIAGNITFTATTLPVVMLLLSRQRGWSWPWAVAVPAVVALVAVVALTSLPAAIAGALGVLGGLLTTLPQLIESVQRKRAGQPSEVSKATLCLLLAGQALWLSYGLARPDLPMILTNVVAATVTTCLIAVEFTRRPEYASSGSR